MTAISIGDGEGAFTRGTIGIVVVDAEARLLRVNHAFTDMTGIAPDLEGGGAPMRLHDMLDPSVDATVLLDLLMRFDPESGIVPSRSIDYRRPDGCCVGQVEIGVIARSLGEDGRPDSVTLSLVDITEGCGVGPRDEPKVRSAQIRYKDIYENIVEGIYRSSLDGVQLSANPALVRLNGYDSEAEMLTAVGDIAKEWYTDPTRRETFQELLHRQGFVSDFVSEIYRHKTRERIWISENARLVRDPESGEPLCYEGTIREVTTTVELLQEKEKLDKIAAQAPGCLFQSRLPPGARPFVSYASAGLTTLCGLEPAEMIADMCLFERRIHPDDRAALMQAIIESAQTLQPWRNEFRMRRTDGVDIWVGGAALPERLADGTVVWHGFMQDVTEAREAQAKIHDLAFYDTLTTLPNRRMLRDRARKELAASDRSGHYGAVLFIDLDRFKALNDTHGHHVGDRLLIEVARRLEGCLRANDLVARLGGDEFVVLLTQLSRDRGEASDQADTVAEKVRATITLPFSLGEIEDGSGKAIVFHTSPSIGVEVFQGHAIDFDTLLKRADMAMYRAKANGRNAVRRFSVPLDAERHAPVGPPDMGQGHEIASIASEAREAIETDAIDLFIQPLVASDGRIVGGEALLRWLHPERGVVVPNELFETADRIGLSGRLHDLILRRACAIAVGWRDTVGLGALTLSINIAPMQIQAEGFADTVAAIAAETGAPTDRLVFEVTEHAILHDIASVAETMRAMKATGIRFALDDFGTGYASLTYLKRLPLDEIKIDQSFVQEVTENRDAAVIVGTTIITARQLGLSVTGEGVETAKQAQALIGFGIDQLQGHLFGRPMPEPAFRKLVIEAEADRTRAKVPVGAAEGVRLAS